MKSSYIAFISYKHAEYSRSHAVSLETAIKKFAKPLFSLPERIFRDEKYLIPSNDLPKAIKNGLANSQTLIFLAEEQSANSTWCQDELLCWCQELKRSEQIIIVLLNDQIAVDTEKRIIWEHSNALPRLLQEYITHVPLFIDLTWASRPEERVLLNGRYKENITQIIAKLKNKTPEELTDEDYKTAKRNRRIRVFSVTTIAILFVLSLIFGFVANYQRKQALKNYAKSLSSSADAILNTDPTIAFSIAKKAFQLNKEDGQIYFTLLSASQFYHYTEKVIFDRNIRIADLSPDSKTALLINSHGNVFIFDLTSKETKKLNHPGIISKAVYSPDGSYFATSSYDSSVYLWNSFSLESRKIRNHSGLVYALQFSHDGTKLMSASNDGIVRIWELKTDKYVELSTRSEQVFSSISFSLDDKKLLTTCSTTGSVRIWNIEHNNKISKSLNEYVHNACFSSDGMKAFICTNEGNIYSWSVAGNVLKRTYHFNGSITSILSNKKDQIFALCSDGTIRFFKTLGEPIIIESLPASISEYEISSDGTKLITGDSGGNIKLWDLENDVFLDFKGHTGEITGLKFSKDKVISSSDDKSIRIWKMDLVGTKKIELQIEHADVSLSKKILATTSLDSLVRIIDTQTGQVQILKLKKRIYNLIKWSPNEDKILLVDLNVAIIVDIRSSKVNMYERHTQRISSAEISPDGMTLVTSGADSSVIIWNIENKSYRLLGKTAGFRSKAFFSPDGKKIGVFSDSAAMVWDLLTFKFKDLPAPIATVDNMMFSSDSRFVIVTSLDSGARIWDLNSMKVKVFKEADTQLTNAYLGSDGKHLITTSRDNVIKIWDLDGNIIRSIQSPFAALGKLEFWPEKDYLFFEGGQRLYFMDIGQNNLIKLNEEGLWLEELVLFPDKSSIVGVYKNGIRIWYLDPDILNKRSENDRLTWKLDSLTLNKYGIY